MSWKITFYMSYLYSQQMYISKVIFLFKFKINYYLWYYTIICSINTSLFIGSLIQTVREVRPTIFLGVPRVWEKLAIGIQNYGSSLSGFKKKISKWAKDIGLRGNLSKQNGYILMCGQYVHTYVHIYVHGRGIAVAQWQSNWWS